MTNLQKKQITDMRNDGQGYTTIAKTLGITKDRVKAYCRINNLTGFRASNKSNIKTIQQFCMQCGKQLIHTPDKKKKKFCSDVCRNTWWNSHPTKIKRKAFYQFVCKHCNKSFEAYGNSERLFCSHSCYIENRFYAGDNND